VPASSPPLPLLIYGASSAVGAFALKLALASNIHPIIAIAGAGLPLVKSLIDPSKGDLALDYRDGEQALSSAIAAAGISPSHALDAISESGSAQLCARLLGTGGALAHVLPLPEDFPKDSGVTATMTMVGIIHGMLGEDPAARLFGEVYMRAFARGLEKGGWMSGHPWEVVEGGLQGLQGGLERLKEGKVSGKKLVYRIVD
jgi:NADPH:quinone reductase-like Zn-dependent oxidoreductase